MFFRSLYFKKVSSRLLRRAFTLVELMVVVAIITTLSAVAIFNGTGFNEASVLANIAQDVALTIRQAQNYSTNVRRTTDASPSYNDGYGVELTTATPTTFFTFSDNATTGTLHVYDSSTDAVESTYSFDGGYSILRICGSNGVSDDLCLTSGQLVDISFLRPDPEATIKFMTSGHVALVNSTYNSVRIYLQSRSGKVKRVEVWVTGFISVL